MPSMTHTPPSFKTLPVHGSNDVFPVSRIFCVGQNYAEHAREMGGDPTREKPFFFSKPWDALMPLGGTLSFPQPTENLHFEGELAVLINKGGRNLSPAEAKDCVFGFATALDMTKRDLQTKFKETGRPWDMAKGFDQSCPCGPVVPVAQSGWLDSGSIQTRHNTKVRQDSDLDHMTWPVDELLSQLSIYIEIKPGDLIMTGTPAGVWAVKPGDELEVTIANLPSVAITYTKP